MMAMKTTSTSITNRTSTECSFLTLAARGVYKPPSSPRKVDFLPTLHTHTSSVIKTFGKTYECICTSKNIAIDTKCTVSKTNLPFMYGAIKKDQLCKPCCD